MLPLGFNGYYKLVGDEKINPIFSSDYLETLTQEHFIDVDSVNKIIISDKQNRTLTSAYTEEVSNILKASHNIDAKEEILKSLREEFLSLKYMDILSVLNSIPFPSRNYIEESLNEFFDKLPNESFGFDEKERFLYFKGVDGTIYQVDFTQISP